MKKNNFIPNQKYETPCVESLGFVCTGAIAASGEEGVTIVGMTEIDEEW